MLHVVTVHWCSDAWIDPQLHFLDKHAPDGTRVWAALHDVDPSHRRRFHFAEDVEGTHPQKLNRLAEIVSADAGADDHLLFLDGDAFPIAPLAPILADPAPLVAVRRDENLGDPQPHPCFCATTVRFWNEIGGDWRGGHRWTNAAGKPVTDVGGNLLGLLLEAGIDWRPLLRTNVHNPHPLWFAVYGDVAYHHGAGFRDRHSRVDGVELDPERAARRAHIPRRVPVLGRLERAARRKAAEWRRARWERGAGADLEALGDEIYDQICVDDEFYRRFTG